MNLKINALLKKIGLKKKKTKRWLKCYIFSDLWCDDQKVTWWIKKKKKKTLSAAFALMGS